MVRDGWTRVHSPGNIRTNHVPEPVIPHGFPPN